MNISKYREKNLVSVRGLFLIFCISYVFGDSVWVSSWLMSLNSLLCICLYICVAFSGRFRIYSLIGLLAFSCGSFYGNYYSHRTIERISVLQAGGLYEWKKHITGKIDTVLFSKERSTTYRLLIDKIDNRSTEKLLIPGPYSIFVEIPSNLDISPWDSIAFTGKIQKILDFPLKGYARYAFYQWWYGTIFLPNFTQIYRSEPSYLEQISIYWVDRFQKWFPRDVSSILLGITIWVDSYLSSELKNAFIKSGISHILVVSGSNIAFLIFFLMFFLKYISLRRYVRICIIWGCVFFYSSLVWWDVSVVRATIMGILSYVIAEYGWRASSISTLVLAWFVLTLYSPLAPIYDAWFWLSFAATIGILIFHDPIERIWKKTRFSRAILPFISASIWATLGSLPIMIYHFWMLPIWTILINVLIASVLGWILFLSILYIPLVSISPLIGYYLWYLIYFPTKYILILADHFQYGLQLIIAEDWRNIIALILIGLYSTLMVERGFYAKPMDLSDSK